MIFIELLLLTSLLLGFALAFALRANKVLREMLETDFLTGLLSNRQFLIEAGKMLEKAPNDHFALVCLGINHFKSITETYEHEEGNRLLSDMGKMLKGFTRPNELASHAFADSFTLLLRYDDRNELYDRLNSSEIVLETAFHRRGAGYRVIISSGLYIMADGADASSLESGIVNANYAKDKAKGPYRNTLITFEDKMKIDMDYEKELEDVMNIALENSEFVPYFQAKTNILTGETVGAEALVRWRDPEKGLRMPGEFIPFFESSGFIVKLDMYIFDRLCAQIASWLERGLLPPRVSCNFSRLHNRNSGFVQEILAIARKHKVPPYLLELEITESVAIDVEDMSASFFEQLRPYGFRTAIDDFGTGYSSLAVLDQLEIDVLKLDRGFFAESKDSAARKAIVRHLVSLAKDLRIQVVCEGIETEEQENTMKELGCYIAQGFKYSLPEPADIFEKHLKSDTNLSSV